MGEKHDEWIDELELFGNKLGFQTINPNERGWSNHGLSKRIEGVPDLIWLYPRNNVNQKYSNKFGLDDPYAILEVEKAHEIEDILDRHIPNLHKSNISIRVFVVAYFDGEIPANIENEIKQKCKFNTTFVNLEKMKEDIGEVEQLEEAKHIRNFSNFVNSIKYLAGSKNIDEIVEQLSEENIKSKTKTYDKEEIKKLNNNLKFCKEIDTTDWVGFEIIEVENDFKKIIRHLKNIRIIKKNQRSFFENLIDTYSSFQRLQKNNMTSLELINYYSNKQLKLRKNFLKFQNRPEIDFSLKLLSDWENAFVETLSELDRIKKIIKYFIRKSKY